MNNVRASVALSPALNKVLKLGSISDFSPALIFLALILDCEFRIRFASHEHCSGVDNLSLGLNTS